MTSFEASPLKLELFFSHSFGELEKYTYYIWASFPKGLAFSDSKILS
jgi:hypothetical protein